VKVSADAFAVVQHAEQAHLVMQAGVLDGDSRGQGQRLDQGLVLVVERARTLLFGEVQVAVDLGAGTHPDGHAQETLHGRMPGGESVALWVRAQVIQAKGLGVGDEESQHAPAGRSGSDCALLFFSDPHSQELVQRAALLVEHTKGAVTRVDQGARLLENVSEQDRELDIGLDHQHGVHQASNFGDILDALVGHGPIVPSRQTTKMRTDPPRRTGDGGATSGHWHNEGMAIRVFLLDDHELVREGIRSLFDGDEDIEIVGEAGTAARAMVMIPLTKPDVAILDVRLEDGNGIEVCREMRSVMPELACLMLTSYADDEALYASVMAGAAGYVLKQVKARDLIGDVKKVASGASLIDPKTVARVVERILNPPKAHPELETLSPQQRRILDLIAEGLTNRQIADAMFLSEKTVKNYITGLLAKLRMNSRTEAAIYATKLKATDLGANPA